jgi:sugar-specific transcriptional regulator TrmB
MINAAVEDLEALGFSEYEARAYIALLQRGPLSGYQVAKTAGIPRPNIYPVLDRLQEKGAVGKTEGPEGVRYAALPAGEMLSRIGRDATARLENARKSIQAIEGAPETPQVWNIQGYDRVLSRAGEMIDGATEKLLIGIRPDEARQLAGALARAEARSLDLTVLCIEGCPAECGGCRGEVFRYALAAGEEKRWLVISADDRELMVAQVSPDGTAIAGVTRLQAFVAVGSHYLQNAVAAAEITRSLGPRLEELLDERALRALTSTGLAAGGSSWLDRMLEVTGAGR